MIYIEISKYIAIVYYLLYISIPFVPKFRKLLVDYDNYNSKSPFYNVIYHIEFLITGSSRHRNVKSDNDIIVEYILMYILIGLGFSLIIGFLWPIILIITSIYLLFKYYINKLKNKQIKL